MSDHFQQIYANHADQYEALVAREDYQGNILAQLQIIRPLAGLDVVEFGAGTGRLTMLLIPHVKHIHAFDGSQHMLDVAIGKLQKSGLSNWKTDVADNRQMPVPDASADFAIQGWSFGHFCGWYPDSWREEIGKALAEMRRVLRPGGTIVMLETMGTGRETPQPPTPALAEYYAWLEDEHDFSSTSIRTDYRFESLAEAEQLARFFFGDEMAAQVIANKWVILPECTGVWWKTVS
ncbi:MAG: class I SAM-dependent methyltransferase [Anaerolineae bacterium]|nr:class I SAM-dependent methyltransferase [Anaerolineae bacterium]